MKKKLLVLIYENYGIATLWQGALPLANFLHVKELLIQQTKPVAQYEIDVEEQPIFRPMEGMIPKSPEPKNS